MSRALTVWLLVLSFSAPALAQTEGVPEPSADELAARFAAGMEAMEADRFDEALEAFRAVYAATGAPSALFNEAWVLRRLARYVQAEERLEVLLGRSDIDERWRRDSEMLLAQVRERVAQLRLVGVPSGAAELQLDAESRPVGVERPIVLRVDPGRHALTVDADGFERFSWSGEVAPAASVDIAVALERPVAVEAPAAALDPAVVVDASLADHAEPPSSGPSTSVAESPWLWLGVVLGLAAIGVGVGLGIYFQGAAQVQPADCPPGAFCFQAERL